MLKKVIQKETENPPNKEVNGPLLRTNMIDYGYSIQFHVQFNNSAKGAWNVSLHCFSLFYQKNYLYPHVNFSYTKRREFSL